MNGDHRRWAGLARVVQISRRESGLPVMGMHDFGLPARQQPEADLGRNPTESGAALGVFAYVSGRADY